jgi:hypothetical protein
MRPTSQPEVTMKTTRDNLFSFIGKPPTTVQVLMKQKRWPNYDSNSLNSWDIFINKVLFFFQVSVSPSSISCVSGVTAGHRLFVLIHADSVLFPSYETQRILSIRLYFAIIMQDKVIICRLIINPSKVWRC